MSKTLNLKAVKIKIYNTVLEDGLLEIMMGIYLSNKFIEEAELSEVSNAR